MSIGDRLRDAAAVHMQPVEGMAATRWLFLRVLALVSLAAFLSFNAQAPALMGEHGVDPLGPDIEEVKQQYRFPFLEAPTLSLWLPGNGLQLLTGAGAVLSVLLFLDVAPVLILVLLWLCYMSLVVNAGSLGWFFDDLLLVETLFFAIFLAPRTLRPAGERNGPQRIAVDGIRFLLFKLLLFAGLVKVIGNNAFDTLSAMQFYFLTQPFPTPLAWLLDKLPPTLLSVLSAWIIVLELSLSFFVFAPRRYRIGAAYVIGTMFLGIELTGNYGFLNVLPIVLCIMLLDDRHLGRLRTFLDPIITAGRSVPLARTAAVAVTVLLLVNVPLHMDRFWHARSPAPVTAVADEVEPFRTVNTYSPFGRVPVIRYGYVIQGSMDNETWRSYGFRYKPDRVTEPPPVVPLHQPRLDHTVWGAANTGAGGRWMRALLDRLLQGSDPVEERFATVPFDRPPQVVRVVQYRYRFSDWSALLADGVWWRRWDRTVVVRRSSPGGTARRHRLTRAVWFDD